MKRILIAAVLILLPLCTVVAQSPPLTCSSNLWQIDTLASTDAIATSVMPAFANLADMHDFDFYMTSSACVKVEVSFVVASSSVGQFEIRALYDDNPAVTMPSIIKVGPGLPLGYHTFTFLVYSGSGNHHVDVQIRGAGGGIVVTTGRTLIVTH